MTLEDLQCVLAMPAYNEEECIEKVVRAWIAEFEKHFQRAFQIIVVNDGSKDQTGAVLDRLAASDARVRVIHQPNGGHGNALLTGYRAAAETPALAVFQVDSDDQFLPSEFGPLWKLSAQSKFVMGYRKERHDALHRQIITRILKFVLFLFFGIWVVDANIPYRIIRRTYLKGLLGVLPSGIFAPNIFLTVLAAKDGQKLGFMPITHEDRKTGTVSIVRWNLIKMCIRSTRELFAFRLSLSRRVSDLRRTIVNAN